MADDGSEVLLGVWWEGLMGVMWRAHIHKSFEFLKKLPSVDVGCSLPRRVGGQMD